MAARRYLLLIVAALALTDYGCRVNSSYVYVDLDKAVESSPAPSMPVVEPDSRPGAEISTTFTIAGAPESAESRSGAEGAAKVAASIMADRDRTYRAIVRRLHDAYVREANNMRAQQLVAFEPVRAKTMAEAMARISAAYVAYADKVGPKIAQLAVNAGFPDPDKTGRHKPSGAEGLDTLAYETSQRLRAEIRTLQAQFKLYSATTLRSAGASVDAQLTDLLARVDREVGDIDARAEDVAKHEVSQANAELGPLLADQPPQALPAVPESRVVVKSAPVPAAPAPTAGWTGAEATDSLARVQDDLKIWLAVNRYVLEKKGLGRDATAEFIAWRNRFKLEPSARP